MFYVLTVFHQLLFIHLFLYLNSYFENVNSQEEYGLSKQIRRSGLQRICDL